MATFIEVHTANGPRKINIDHIVYFGANINTDKEQYPGYILCDKAMMDGIRTKETYEKIERKVFEAQTGCRL